MKVQHNSTPCARTHTAQFHTACTHTYGTIPHCLHAHVCQSRGTYQKHEAVTYGEEMMVNYSLVLSIVLYVPKFVQYILSLSVIGRRENDPQYRALAAGSVSVLGSFEVSETSTDSDLAR